MDFYEVDNKIYFGELTFFDGSGFDKIEPREWDKKLGDWIELPKKGNNYDFDRCGYCSDEK